MTNNFLAELEPSDLARLRRITRAAYARAFPWRRPLTDRQADTIICDLGPEAALDSLSAGRVDVMRTLQ